MIMKNKIPNLKVLIYDTESYINPNYIENLKDSYIDSNNQFIYFHKVKKGLKDFSKNYFEIYLKENVNFYLNPSSMYLYSTAWIM
jgi:hypothetical protein